MLQTARLDRQLRIKGWNQNALEKAKLGVVGDNDLLASLFMLSVSSLGINNLVVVSPALDKILVKIAEKVNPLLTLTHIQGFYTHPVLDDLFIATPVGAQLSNLPFEAHSFVAA